MIKINQLTTIHKDAIFSDDRKHRYVLWRIWEPLKWYVAIIGLNPSTADEVNDDRTVKRCVEFAKREGAGGIFMLNIFAFRSTDPKGLLLPGIDPVGPRNDQFIFFICGGAGLIIAAWGNDGG